MDVVRHSVATLLDLYFVVLIARLVFDWIQLFAREWRPKGPVLVVAEFVYTLTDPPLKAIRKVVPPLRLGGIALDLAFIILALAVQVAANLLR
ncbi:MULTISPECIES: YggT family protein [Dermacoccus]|uniref:YggT family protein n=2 Tax=Dermacoccus TaxID=57495 RepID=A0A417Z761_9MICO|nr:MULTISPECIES: YggT family protein [Dermacoccus]MBE7371912.1 YggT family protein [Dermacoccus barathri]MBZ4498336.1 YggT family protein [Dermacoccus sp. Tok2021]MCT1987179.1 YggT family protein [Dermacoccus abyssi]QNK52368.1 YggT family protein [Dermacoccus sp. PAMC28757]RHW46448.1 YggT family protein [Dermacoccus abyssi]